MSETSAKATPDIVDPTKGLGVSDTIRDYFERLKGGEMGSLPALLAIMVLGVLFSRLSPFFITKLNFANLFQQAATLIVLSSALVFLIILTEIDLSAGVTGGTAMALWVKLVKSGVHWSLALVAAFVVGMVTGLGLGFFVAKIGIPAFVVSLAFFLAYQGVMLVLLGDGGLFRIEVKPLKAIMNKSLPPVLGWIVLIVAAGVSLALSLYDRSQRTGHGLRNGPIELLIAKMAVILIGGALVVSVLNANRSTSKIVIRGMPIVAPIVLFILFVGTFVLDRTRFGRYVYAVGGNPEAARRAGINVSAIRIGCFVICSTLSVVAGLFNALRVSTIESTAGRSIVLSGVAAAVVGGVSLFGGRGKLSNAAIGAIAIAMIDNGLGLLGLKAGISFIVTGGVLLLATTVDALARRRGNSTPGRR